MSTEWERLTGLIDLITPYAVRAAATLRIADHLADGPADVDTLAAACGAHPATLGRLLRYLACRGVFAEAAGGRFALTPLGAHLRSDHPSGVRGWLDAEGAGGRMDAAVPELLASVRSGEAAYPSVFGRGVWEDLAALPGHGAWFDALMAGHCRSFAPDVVAARDWAGEHVVDVGGGTGTLLAAILVAHPDAAGTLVELPATAAAARATLDGARCTVVAGSFFDPLPPGGDAYVLAQVLHDWDDAEAGAILTRCAEAAGPHGRVVVVERLLDGADPMEMTGMDLRMLLVFGSRERTHADLVALAARAGLREAATATMPSGFAVLELRSA